MAFVYDNLRLHITDDAFYIEALNAGSRHVLVINRIDNEINLKSDKVDIPPSSAESKVKIFDNFLKFVYVCIV